MDTSKPGPLLMLGGGAVMVLGSILKWFEGTSGLETDVTGLLGIFVLLSGLLVIGVGAVRAFGANVNLPDDIAGFSLDQICLFDAFAAFLWTFALVVEDGNKIGLHLSWLGAAVAVAGAVLSSRQTPAAAQGGGW